MMTEAKRIARAERKRIAEGRAKIAELLRTSDKAVERAMVVLYERQTTDEKASSDTKHDNQRGFSAFHAPSGSYYARLVLSGRRLYGKSLAKARRFSLRYTRQLLDAADQKAKKNLPVAKLPETVCTGCGFPIPLDEYCACRGYGD